MALSRTWYDTLVDATPGVDGTGTLWDKADVDALMDAIDVEIARLDTADAAAAATTKVCEGRLTLTSGTPVTTADVTAATSVLWTPSGGKSIALISSGIWVARTFAETSHALGTMSIVPYDVYGYDNAGTFALEKLAWTNGTTRATGLTRTDGVLVKSGDSTRRYLATIYPSSTTTVEDSATKRFVNNYYNRVPRRLARVETTANWAYTVATIRQANANTANKVEMVVGVAEDVVRLRLTAMAANGSNVVLLAGIGQNSITAFATDYYGGGASTQAILGAYTALVGQIDTVPAVGYNYFSMLEASAAAGTTTWYSSITGFGERLATLSGAIHG
jgi:hypothetical protein